MPIGAAIGGAVIGVGGSMLSAGAQKSAARTASNAEVAMARENSALAREFRQANEANFQPWMQSGGRANALVDSFLYGAPTAASPTAPGTQPGTTPGSTVPPAVSPHVTDPRTRLVIGALAHLSPNFRNRIGDERIRELVDPGTPAGTPTAPPTGTVTAQPDAYQAFVNSPYYQNPLKEGMNQLNNGLASRGMINSGAAIKQATRYGQDYASGRMGEFLGLAERQSDRGIQGASAIAGVGQNALASQTASNTAIGQSQAARAIASGNATAGMYAGIGNALGSAIGGLGRSSYGF